MTTAQAELYGSVAAGLPRVCDILDATLASDELSVQELLGTIQGRRGKMLRPALVLLSGHAVGRCTEAHDTLAAVVEMMHLASLVHDDVIDEADSRRERPSVNRTVGNEAAVLLGDYVMSNAFQLCTSIGSSHVDELLGSTCRVVCLGEMMQVAQRRNLRMTEAQYLDIIARKTAWLLRTCGLFGAHLAEADPDSTERLGRYGHALGMAFQIADDMLDLAGSEEEMGKTLGRDLAKGDLTLPLIRFLNTASDAGRSEMVDALSNGHPGGLERVRQLVLDGENMAYCSRIARDHADQAISLLDDLPPTEARDCMSAVAEFVLTRRC